MILETVVVGFLMTNCYILADKRGGDAVVIDPGDDASSILDVVNGEELNVKYVLNTHGHFDHNGANEAIKLATGAKIAAAIEDGNAGIDRRLSEGDVVKVGSLEIKVKSTSGHSAGSISLMVDNMLFSGDLIFAGSVGRTDFQGGSLEELRESLEWVLTLPDDTIVYPGHGEHFGLSAEKTSNPYLVWAGKDE